MDFHEEGRRLLTKRCHASLHCRSQTESSTALPFVRQPDRRSGALAPLYTNRMARDAHPVPVCEWPCRHDTGKGMSDAGSAGRPDASRSLIYGATWSSGAFTIAVPDIRAIDPAAITHLLVSINTNSSVGIK